MAKLCDFKKLLQRNMFLNKETKKKLLKADKEIVAGIMPKLEEMCREQVRVFEGVIERNPNFFDGWGKATVIGGRADIHRPEILGQKQSFVEFRANDNSEPLVTQYRLMFEVRFHVWVA